MTDKVRTEEFQVNGEALVAKVRELIHAGNVRRIILKNEAGQTLVEIPLTLGVVGAVLLPVWAAIGAIAALAARLTIVVEKVDKAAPEPTAEAGQPGDVESASQGSKPA